MEKEYTNIPFWSINKSGPPATVREVPSTVVTLPTTTNPRCNTPSAVVKPSGGFPWENTFAFVSGAAAPPEGRRVMIVVPVPWRLLELLKFETRTSPDLKAPAVGNPGGTKAMP